MIVLSDHDLKNLLQEKEARQEDLKIWPPPAEQAIDAYSIDLRLSPILLKYPPQTIRLGNSEILTQEIDMEEAGGYMLAPGEFILGTTLEEVSFSEKYGGFIETKGNIARAGIQVHNGDGHIAPGFRGHITLEISNMHREGVFIKLVPGIYICQLFVYPLSSPSERPYRGKYYGQNKPTPYRP
jgi:dCTP deaminase